MADVSGVNVSHSEGLENIPKKYGTLIAISLFFAPYTALRVFQIGVSELSILLLFGLALFSKRIRVFLTFGERFVFTRFWLLFFLFAFLGFAYNHFFMNPPSGSLSSTVFDLAAYLLIFVCCISLESLFGQAYAQFDFDRLFKSFYTFSSIALFLLFVISRVRGSLLGFPLNFFGAFRPFATNIHHVSMFVAPLPFLGLKCAADSKHWHTKVLFVSFVISNIVIGINTRSTKVVMAFYLGFFVYLISETLLSRQLRPFRRVLLLLLITVALLLSMVFWTSIFGQASSFFEQEDLSGTRSVIYRGSLEKSLISPIFGFGPGAHAVGVGGSFNDAHQTLLTALLQGGVFGVIVYSALMLRILIKCTNDPCILGAFFSILLYSLGGDIMRRLPMWLFLVLFYYYCEQKSHEE